MSDHNWTFPGSGLAVCGTCGATADQEDAPCVPVSRDTRTDGDPGMWAVPPQSETVSRDTPRPPCVICGEPMPKGEEMFKFHGYSGDCPKPPLPKFDSPEGEALRRSSLETPPAPPGLDWDLAMSRAEFRRARPFFSNVLDDFLRREITDQHLAALQQAKRDERARIVKAVAEKADVIRETPGLHPMHAFEWDAARDFIETLEDTP